MKIMITAGDPSGDVHAARLMEALRLRVPDVVFEGFGGPAMEMQGLRSVAHLKDVAVSGFWEVAKRIGYFRELMHTCEQIIKHRKPDLFIPVDYPGFNIRLAAHAKQAMIPVAWYIAPQLWAWGRNRARELARVVSMLLVVFPFEEEFFGRFGIRTVYVGHPLLDQLAVEEQPFIGQLDTHISETQITGAGQLFNSSEKRVSANRSRSIVLLPGSREHEIHYHAPLLNNIIKHFEGSGLSFVVPKAPSLSNRSMQSFVDAGAQIADNSHNAMRSAYAGLVKAGTSTLEAALIGMPFGSYYKTSWLSYTMAKRLVKVNSVTMMNLLLNRTVVHEYIQHDATAGNLVKELEELIANDIRRQELTEAMAQVRDMLGGQGASKRAAEAILGMM